MYVILCFIYHWQLTCWQLKLIINFPFFHFFFLAENFCFRFCVYRKFFTLSESVCLLVKQSTDMIGNTSLGLLCFINYVTYHITKFDLFFILYFRPFPITQEEPFRYIATLLWSQLASIVCFVVFNCMEWWWPNLYLYVYPLSPELYFLHSDFN